ncbi:MAG: NAD-dependent epimerase/dehydratase family protein [Caldilineales bacterium]
MRCAFVTGGDGFIGSHLIRQLLARGVSVRALTRSGAAATRADLPAGVEWVTGDLLEPAGWRERLRGCDVGFHVAALYSPRPEDAARMYAVNFTGTRHVLEACAAADVARVVHTSTVGVVGRPADGSLPDENTPFNLWSTGSEYVRSKWLGEAAALLWSRRGLDVVVVQPTAPVGAGDHKPTATGQRVVDFLAGRRPGFPTGGMNVCAVQDIAAGHILAAELGQSGQRYILGHVAGNLSEEEFLALLAEVSGQPAPAPVARSAGRGPASLTVDPRRAVRELGMPQSSLRQAFADAVTFYRSTL